MKVIDGIKHREWQKGKPSSTPAAGGANRNKPKAPNDEEGKDNPITRELVKKKLLFGYMMKKILANFLLK